MGFSQRICISLDLKEKLGQWAVMVTCETCYDEGVDDDEDDVDGDQG